MFAFGQCELAQLVRGEAGEKLMPTWHVRVCMRWLVRKYSRSGFDVGGLRRGKKG